MKYRLVDIPWFLVVLDRKLHLLVNQPIEEPRSSSLVFRSRCVCASSFGGIVFCIFPMLLIAPTKLGCERSASLDYAVPSCQLCGQFMIVGQHFRRQLFKHKFARLTFYHQQQNVQLIVLVSIVHSGNCIEFR
ncbi:hypothetical protein DPMN_071439 [Dreissena polymorpha]|uniref:Uncharacterized protein n=1 Tax=Dreissena polymorpha TaxID=45954 RepID=A0A9D3Z2M9_DREPO|nr:hypothetical protein DPMN_071439 [Dreissena polymorpha]